MIYGVLIVITYSVMKGYFDLIVGEKKKSTIKFVNVLAEKVRNWMKDSWKNKYRQIKLYGTEESVFIPAPNNWYYRFFKLKYKEDFPLSATLLVFLTDAYHFISAIVSFTLIFLLCLYWALSFLHFIFSFLLLWIVNKVTFHLVYYRFR